MIVLELMFIGKFFIILFLILGLCSTLLGIWGIYDIITAPDNYEQTSTILFVIICLFVGILLLYKLYPKVFPIEIKSHKEEYDYDVYPVSDKIKMNLLKYFGNMFLLIAIIDCLIGVSYLLVNRFVNAQKIFWPVFLIFTAAILSKYFFGRRLLALEAEAYGEKKRTTYIVLYSIVVVVFTMVRIYLDIMLIFNWIDPPEYSSLSEVPKYLNAIWIHTYDIKSYAVFLLIWAPISAISSAVGCHIRHIKNVRTSCPNCKMLNCIRTWHDDTLKRVEKRTEHVDVPDLVCDTSASAEVYDKDTGTSTGLTVKGDATTTIHNPGYDVKVKYLITTDWYKHKCRLCGNISSSSTSREKRLGD